MREEVEDDVSRVRKTKREAIANSHPKGFQVVPPETMFAEAALVVAAAAELVVVVVGRR